MKALAHTDLIAALGDNLPISKRRSMGIQIFDDMAMILYIHATIITVDADQRIFLDGAILVSGSRIVELGKTEMLLQSPELPKHTKICSLKGMIVFPGLINTHAHLCQSLLRGLAEAVPLHSWLCDAIWPLEASYENDDGRVAAELTMCEMLKSGTTCFLEALLPAQSGVESIVESVGEFGIRSCLGKLVKVPEAASTTILSDARDKDINSMSIESALSLHRKYHGSFNDRLHIWMAAVTPRGSSTSAHSKIGEACRNHDIGLTMHCAEAPKDLEIYRDCYDCSPMEFCQKTQLTGPKTVLAHMVNLDLEKDLPILKATRTSVAHNPASNCKLASGIAPVPQMLAAGVNVSLGTDGAPCSNHYDMLREMHLAGIIHKGNGRDASLVDAWQVLAMATINGARALGMEKDIGSLEVGKKADFVVVDPRSLSGTPFDAEEAKHGGVDPVTTVVYSCTGADVKMVVVDGEILVQERKLVRVNEEDVKNRARLAIRGIRQRSGIKSTVFNKCNYM